MVNVEKIKYKGWMNCHRISNGLVELVITADVGPRIMFYGFCGKDNEFCEVPDHLGKTGSDEWRLYGGHRLWHSPEEKFRTYWPDNEPVVIEYLENGVRTIQPPELTTGIQKEMTVELDPHTSLVTVTHFLVNCGVWDVELAAWALTAMATGGVEIVPQTIDDTGLLPNRMLSLWPYTMLNDPRVTWGKEFILLRQDPSIVAPFKFGLSNTRGWAAYSNRNRLFVKRFSHFSGAPYPDYGGSNYETYTTDFMLEMESLSPLVLLQPGDVVEHVEVWTLLDHISAPTCEDDIRKHLLGILEPVTEVSPG